MDFDISNIQKKEKIFLSMNELSLFLMKEGFFKVFGLPNI
jgi:hypothetical protein